MKNRRQVSVIYAALLALVGFGLLGWLSVHSQLQVQNVGAVVGFTLFGIVVVLFGFPAPHVGHVSLDRVVQILMHPDLRHPASSLDRRHLLAHLAVLALGCKPQ